MFSSITEPKYPNAALGVERSELVAISLQGNGRRQFSVKQAAALDIPPGLIEPSFLDVNISDKAAFAGLVREVVESAGLLSQKRWSVSLPSSTARAAILSVDSEPASRQEAEEVIDWKAEQTFGAPASELRLSKFKISPDREGRSRYFATAVKLAVIDEYESVFEGLGWKTGLVLPRALGEANWLIGTPSATDSLLISSNSEGFTALLLRGSEPAVVRSVTCLPNEVDDEIYRLVMYYNDRFGDEAGVGMLQRLLVIGRDLAASKVQSIASEALGRDVAVLSNEETGLYLPGGGLTFDDIAAPAGLASLAF